MYTAAQQTNLDTLRGFVGVLQGYMGPDQSMTGYDGYAQSYTGQFQAVGPYGVAVEGQPISTTQTGAVVISPMFVMLLLGAAAVLILKR